MFAYAGVIYFSSGVETSINKIEKAHAIFKSVGIGFMIVLAAWLGVNTVLHTILDPKQFPEGSWFTIKCVTAANNAPGGRVMDTTINQLLSVLPGLNTAPQVTVGQSSVYVCTSGSYNPDDNNCYGSDGLVTPATLRGTSVSFNQYNGDVSAALDGYIGADTSSGPDDGNLACVWAVNNVLLSAGVPPIDGDSVYGMEQALNKGGRGTYISNTADAQKGDIIVWKDKSVSHAGMCQDAGCTKAISNSSSKTEFNNKSGQTFKGVAGRIYRVNK